MRFTPASLPVSFERHIASHQQPASSELGMLYRHEYRHERGHALELSFHPRYTRTKHSSTVSCCFFQKEKSVSEIRMAGRNAKEWGRKAQALRRWGYSSDNVGGAAANLRLSVKTVPSAEKAAREMTESKGHLVIFGKLPSGRGIKALALRPALNPPQPSAPQGGKVHVFRGLDLHSGKGFCYSITNQTQLQIMRTTRHF